jgi:predicted nuclease of predicted toxin-antitoxin system
VVVSKDSDFNDLAFIHGPPPKVIWLRVGNASTDRIGELLAAANDVVSAFEANEQDAVLVLRLAPGAADNDRANRG